MISYIEFEHGARVHLTGDFPPEDYPRSPQHLRVIRVGLYAGVFSVNHAMPDDKKLPTVRDKQYWTHAQRDTLALRAAGLSDVQADSVLIAENGTAHPGKAARGRLNRLRHVTKCGLLGLVGQAFVRGAFVVEQQDTSVPWGEFDERWIADLRVSAGGSSVRGVAIARGAGVTDKSVKAFRADMFQALGVNSIHAAVMRWHLAGMSGPERNIGDGSLRPAE